MLLWIDGFDSYGTSATPAPSGVLARKYADVAEPTYMNVVAGRLGGYSLILGDNSAYCFLAPGNLTTDSTLVVGVAVMFPGFWHERFLTFYDGPNRGMGVTIETGGELAVYNNNTQLKITSGLGLVPGVWYYIEFKVVCGVSGSYDLHVGTVSQLSDTGVDTRSGSGNNYHTTFRLSGVTLAPTTGLHVDDLYCLDGVGDSVDFLGDMRVVTLRPNGAGNSTDFTPGPTGPNYACVNEVVCDDDTSYVEDDTTGHKDLYDYQDLTGIGSIKAVAVWTDCRETDATPFTLKTVCRSGGADDADAGQSIGSTSYLTKRRILEQDPATVAPWTSVDAAQFGVEVG